jgi:hypothetical protein
MVWTAVTEKVASFEDERRRREELGAYCRHATAILEVLRFSLDQLNPTSRAQALGHVQKELKRLFLP